MLDLVQNDGELAAVLAHEMGHVLADHTQPTPSEEAGQIMASIGGNVANQVVSVQGPYGALAGLAGIVAQEAIEALVVNPESQRKEFEADQIGLFLMADASYDPRNALSLWSVMNERGGDLGPLTFLSSHPASSERLTELEALLPQAMERYHVATSFKPRAKGKRPAQFEPDSFAVATEPQRTQPRPKKQPQWLAIEDGTTIFSSPNTLSRPLRRLKRDEPVSIGYRTGAWYEVTEPVRGYILGVEIYPGRD
jgi:predicted Zn-dependent protease